MACCLPPGHVLTRAEREAITRLREKRAAGLVPPADKLYAVSGGVVRQEPCVTFYGVGNPQVVKKRRKTIDHDVRKGLNKRRKHGEEEGWGEVVKGWWNGGEGNDGGFVRWIKDVCRKIGEVVSGGGDEDGRGIWGKKEEDVDNPQESDLYFRELMTGGT